MAYRVVGHERVEFSATKVSEYAVPNPIELVVPGESVQVWGGGSLVVVDSQNKVSAVFASGIWSHAYREDER